MSLILLGFSQSVGSQIQFKSHQDEQTILLAICLTFQSEDLLCFSIITFFYMFCVFRIDEHFKTSPKVPGIDLNSTRVLFEKLMNSQHSMILEQVCSLHVYSAFITLGIWARLLLCFFLQFLFYLLLSFGLSLVKEILWVYKDFGFSFHWCVLRS